MQKSKQYTSTPNYTDEDGQLKTFTFVDWDRKSKLSAYVPTGNALEQHTLDRHNLIQSILELPAAYCPGPEASFTLRGEGYKNIEWNKEMLQDAGVPFERLQRIKVIIQKRLAIDNTL